MRLLMVQDTEPADSLLRRRLQNQGYEVDLVTTGLDAVRQASHLAYDAILVDLIHDDLDLCRGVRARQCWTPLLLLAARPDVGDRVDGLAAGADDYLTKPFSFAELHARLHALIRRSDWGRPTLLQAAGLRLDPGGRRAWRGDVELALTGREFDLLELFLRHPGGLLSRATIAEHVWGSAIDDASNVVDQYVAYLRRKIDRPFGRSDLHTVRGAGYRLDLKDPPAPSA